MVGWGAAIVHRKAEVVGARDVTVPRTVETVPRSGRNVFPDRAGVGRGGEGVGRSGSGVGEGVWPVVPASGRVSPEVAIVPGSAGRVCRPGDGVHRRVAAVGRAAECVRRHDLHILVRLARADPGATSGSSAPRGVMPNTSSPIRERSQAIAGRRCIFCFSL